MKIWLDKYFGFSKAEFNGLLLLIVIIILLKVTPLVYKYHQPVVPDDKYILTQIEKIEISDQENFHRTRDKIENSTGKKDIRLFKFDPNTIDQAGWETLGLSTKQAASIVNYRNKGGKFYKTEDLQKMYTISPEMYEKLLPYIEIKKFESTYLKKDFQYEKKENVKKALVIVEINNADSAQLDEIKGIGPAFASRILKYRERLGGFYKKEQLMEVYGLDTIKYNEIKNQISINTGNLKTININNALFNDLKKYPYLSYKQINALIQYRKQHGNFSNLADLKKVIILNEEVIQKMAPYITF